MSFLGCDNARPDLPGKQLSSGSLELNSTLESDLNTEIQLVPSITREKDDDEKRQDEQKEKNTLDEPKFPVRKSKSQPNPSPLARPGTKVAPYVTDKNEPVGDDLDHFEFFLKQAKLMDLQGNDHDEELAANLRETITSAFTNIGVVAAFMTALSGMIYVDTADGPKCWGESALIWQRTIAFMSMGFFFICITSSVLIPILGILIDSYLIGIHLL